MAVALDAKTGLVWSTGTSITSFLTVGAGATFLLVGLQADVSSPATATVTWDSGGTNQAMTQIGSTLGWTGTNHAEGIYFYGLVNPTTGLKTVAWNITGEVNVYIFGISFTGTPTSSVASVIEGFNTANLNNTALSVTTGVSIPSGDMAVALGIDVFNGFVNATTENLGGTQIGENEVSTANGVAAYFSGSGSTITASATLNASNLWGAVIVGVKAAASSIPSKNYDWPNPVRLAVIEQTWLSKYNPNLIGKDKLPNRQQYWPVPIGVEPDPRRQWEWKYNQNLIGKDKLPVLQKDFPNPIGYEPDWRRSWTASYILELIGQDKLPFNNQIPVPPPVIWYRSQESWYNLNLIGKDVLPTRSTDRPNPLPIPWYRSWELNLLQSTLRPVSANPFFQLDWPNPTPVTWYRTWESSYIKELIGQDKLPNRQQDWPNPGPISWYRTWESSYIKELIGQDQLPNRQSDWPNPVQPWRLDATWVQGFSNSLAIVVVPFPHSQYDWPLPGQLPRLDETWTWRQVGMIGFDTLPNRQQDWPNPQPTSWYQFWTQNLLLQVPLAPFSQKDWPVPYPVQWYRDWSQNLASQLLPPFRQQSWPLTLDIRDYRSWDYKYLLELIGKDQLPNRQQDWPLPYPVNWYQDYKQNLLQSTLFVSPAPPFSTNRNYDWPLPYPVTWYQFWSQSPAVPPVPIEVITTGGRQVGWDEIQHIEKLSQSFLKDHGAPVPNFKTPFDPTIKARDAAVRLGRLGGIASGISRRK